MDAERDCEMYIDGDGVPFWLMALAIDDARSRFTDVHVRAYKDWTDLAQARLVGSLFDLDVDLVQVTPHAGRSNGTDIAVAVDAVDTHHVSPSGWVALVGNDGDFTPLVEHLRHRGASVLGYGAADASDRLAAACDDFVRFDPTTRAPTDLAAHGRPVHDVVAEVVARCAGEDGWTPLDRFGQSILAGHGVRASHAGARTWSRYFRSHHWFECSRGPDGFTWVRLRHTARDVSAVNDRTAAPGGPRF